MVRRVALVLIGIALLAPFPIGGSSAQTVRPISPALRHRYSAVSQGTACKLVLSGALSGSMACSAIAATASDGHSSIAISGAGSVGQVTIEVVLTGQFMSGSYSDSNAEHVAATVHADTMSLWVCNGGSDASGDASGSVATTVSVSPSGMVTTAQGSVYVIHGTATANCPAAPGSGAAGAVSITATF